MLFHRLLEEKESFFELVVMKLQASFLVQREFYYADKDLWKINRLYVKSDERAEAVSKKIVTGQMLQECIIW